MKLFKCDLCKKEIKQSELKAIPKEYRATGMEELCETCNQDMQLFDESIKSIMYDFKLRFIRIFFDELKETINGTNKVRGAATQEDS